MVNSAVSENSPLSKSTTIFVITVVEMLWTHEAAQWPALIDVGNMLKDS